MKFLCDITESQSLQSKVVLLFKGKLAKKTDPSSPRICFYVVLCVFHYDGFDTVADMLTRIGAFFKSVEDLTPEYDLKRI